MSFFFAWVDPNETTFGVEHEVVDEDIVSAELAQEEGDFATLKLTIRNPRIGLLNASRKVWAWFAYSDGVTTTPLFFGRLVGIPSDILSDLISLDLIARPLGYAALKAAYANDLRVLPYYDPVFFQEEERADPDSVLNARSAAWHIDRLTHEISISDILEGEDGTIDVTAVKALYDSVKVEVTGTPISKVTVKAAFNWDQIVGGFVTVVRSVFDHMFNGGTFVIETFSESLQNSWPTEGSDMGGGWSVANGSCTALYGEFDVFSHPFKTNNPIPDSADLGPSATFAIVYNESGTLERLNPELPEGSFTTGDVLTQFNSDWQYDPNTNELKATNISSTRTEVVVPLQKLFCRLELQYKPERRQQEFVTFELSADMQALLTEADGSEAVELTFDSADLDVPIGYDLPIGDVRSRSYITRSRGRQSLEYLIGVARATIRANARAVRVEFELVDMADWLNVTLRKNATLHDPRLPGGQATGKITGYQLSMSDGALIKRVRIECAIGKGGTPTAAAGEPTYVSADYVGADYQVFTGRVDVATVGDVAYTVPEFAPNDDGIEFAGVSQRSMESRVTLTFENGKAVALAAIQQAAAFTSRVFDDTGVALEYVPQEVMDAIPQKIQEAMKDIPHTIKVTCPPLNGEFLTEYGLDVGPLYIPKQIDLEAASA